MIINKVLINLALPCAEDLERQYLSALHVERDRLAVNHSRDHALFERSMHTFGYVRVLVCVVLLVAAVYLYLTRLPTTQDVNLSTTFQDRK